MLLSVLRHSVCDSHICCRHSDPCWSDLGPGNVILHCTDDSWFSGGQATSNICPSGGAVPILGMPFVPVRGQRIINVIFESKILYALRNFHNFFRARINKRCVYYYYSNYKYYCPGLMCIKVCLYFGQQLKSRLRCFL